MPIIKLILFIVLIPFISCNTHTSKNERLEIIKDSQSYNQIIKDKNLEIVIEDAQSYKYDLTKEVFTIFFMAKTPVNIYFHLTDDERNRIIDKYYELGINQMVGKNKITGNIYIEDNCMDMPKLTTILKVKSKERLQVIEIDTGCDDFYQPFYLSNYNVAKRIKDFLQFALSIIQSKPSLKNSPQSDIIYM
jgi:hypothetical protein